MKEFLLIQIELYKQGKQTIDIDTIHKLAAAYLSVEEIKELEV